MKDCQEIRTDILIIGSGIAGATAALYAADQGLKVLLTSSLHEPDRCNSAYAQGGIIYKNASETPKDLEKDILIAGSHQNYLPAVAQLAKLGPRCVEEVLFNRLGIPFDLDSQKNVHLTSEGAHSFPRIIHVADHTGKTMEEAFLKALEEHPNIRFEKGWTAIDLLTTGHSSLDLQDKFRPNSCFGAYIFDQKKEQVNTILANETVLATGGLGGLYLHTTNTEMARGDGVAMAHRAGARIINMEYIQFHPTGLFHPSKPRCLLSEALRGEGAVLVNHHGHDFMKSYHPLGSLAPRDVVSRAIADQMIKEDLESVFLDISFKDSAWIKDRFPTITNKCEQYGYDLTKAPVPVVPVAHYSCGGILVDLSGRTSIHGLRAIGETSCTGLHGANRLASTSLLECLVWGYMAAKDMGQSFNEAFTPPPVAPWRFEKESPDPALICQDWMTIRSTMWNYVGPTRSVSRLERANHILRNLQREILNFYDHASLSDLLIGLRNGVDAALTVVYHALTNKKSIGCHFFS